MRKFLRLTAIAAITYIPIVGCSDSDTIGFTPIGDAGAGGTGNGGRSGGGGVAGTALGGNGGMVAMAGMGGVSGGAAGDGGTAGTGNSCSLTECGSECVDTATTEAHCGSCDRACSSANASASECTAGVCGATCNAGFADCSVDDGSGADDGCETDLNENTLCGTTCENRVACDVGAFCVDGACDATCESPNTECGDTCESLDTATDHCNACDRACSGDGVLTLACVAGACVPACDPGFGDCSVDIGTGTDDGCETNLNTAADDCGACDRGCDDSNTTALACTSGACAPTCSAGFDDCNVDDGNGADDGCETAVTTTADCGVCGRACDDTNTTALACTSGACRPTCSAGFEDCNVDDGNGADDGCETNLNSGATCGLACDPLEVCGVGETCDNGECTTDCSQTECGTECVNIDTSASHCGACDRACSDENVASGVCTDGACAPVCDANFGNCNPDTGGGSDGGADDGCETDFTAEETCGLDCDNLDVCAGNESCVDGVCTANCLLTECGLECVDTDETAAHCGACDRACLDDAAVASTSCSGGLCAPVCEAGFADCSVDNGTTDDGCETVTNTDASCGTACGNVVACGVDQGCVSGVCVNDNLITNSTFEAGFAPWFNFGGGTMGLSASGKANTGNFSGRLSARGATNHGAGYDLLRNGTQPQVIPGATYRFRGFVSIAGATTSVAHVTLRHQCNGVQTFNTMAFNVPVNDTTFTLVTGTQVIPSNCTLNPVVGGPDRLQVYVEGPPAGVEIFVDDATFVRQ